MNLPRIFLCLALLAVASARADYVSPYHFAPSVSDLALTADFHQLPRDPANWQHWSRAPYARWYDLRFIMRVTRSIWGPRFLAFPAPVGVMNHPPAWQQLRVVAAGAQIANRYPYAHHHMQVWNAPALPAWTVRNITPGQGIDCSDFTNWMYNYGLGLPLPTCIREQAAITGAVLTQADGRRVRVTAQRICDIHAGFAKDYTALTASLQPGDLLFIRGRPDPTAPISHVIMWLGNTASDTNGRDPWLVLDSHGDKVIDSNGVTIPSGPRIRPFRQKSYYFNCYDHALRLLPLTPG